MGEMGIWIVVVANRRQERVLRLGDDPTQQTMPSIYSVLERWPVNFMETHDGRRGGGALAQTISGFHRGGLTGDEPVI